MTALPAPLVPPAPDPRWGVLTAYTAGTRTAPLVPQGDARRLGWAVGARGRGALRLGRGLALFVALATEAPLRPYDFQIVRGTTTSTVARSVPVRIIGELGLGGWCF